MESQRTPPCKDGEPYNPSKGIDDEEDNKKKAVVAEKYRKADNQLMMCSDGGEMVVLCSHAGKVGKKKEAAISATLVWLTCPALNNLIARFERHGAIKMFSELISSEKSVRELHVDSHKTFHEFVRRVLPAPQRDFFFAHFVDVELEHQKFGNAGVSHATDMKCAHALAAQTLAGAPNPIGCLVVRYIAFLGKTVPVLDLPTKDNEEPTAETKQKISSFRAHVDDLTNMVNFWKEHGEEMLTLSNFDKDGEDLCLCAKRILVALEGHEPRTRKKHRRN